MVETIMDKGMMTQGTYENAKVAKHAVKYGVLCTVQHFAKTWLDCPLKEGTVQGWQSRYNHKVPIVADHASL